MIKYCLYLTIILITSSGVTMADALNRDFVASTKALKKDLERVFETKNIYFGHQSVGDNILEGAQSLLRRSGIDLNIKQLKVIRQDDKNGLYHSYIGQNDFPSSKIEEFQKIVSIDMKDKLDYASFKFCFVDFTKDTDAVKIFEKYKQTISTIKTSNPKVTIIHFTVPLMTVQEEGIKTFIKRLIGKPIGGYDNNIVRNEFNALLREEYGGKMPIFDIAKLESTLLDGTKITFEDNGKKYESLAEVYTKDGGHLNELGKDYIGYEFLKFLSKLEK